jgi:2-methylaconitate cis-trans-isomerase PrpF
VSTTSKVCIISPSKSPEYDVNYNFGQVSIDRAIVDYQGNCGNMSAAVGPYAIDEALISGEEPLTKVSIYQVNTRKKIVAEVPVKDNLYNEEGDYYIDGVPNPGGRIVLHYYRPEASVTKALLPTGNTVDIIDVPHVGPVEASIVDAANPLVFFRARDLGLKGTEVYEIDADEEIRQKIEFIRAEAAVMVGLAESREDASQRSQAVPKIAFVSEPQSYRDITGRQVDKNDIDLVGRIMSMGTLHKAYAGTGAICTAGAARIKGTVVNSVAAAVREDRRIRLGHPGGVIAVGARLTVKDNQYVYEEAVMDRTARRLMEGYVLVPERFFK